MTCVLSDDLEKGREMTDKVVVVIDAVDENNVTLEMQFPEDVDWADKPQNKALMESTKLIINLFESIGGKVETLYETTEKELSCSD